MFIHFLHDLIPCVSKKNNLSCYLVANYVLCYFCIKFLSDLSILYKILQNKTFCIHNFIPGGNGFAVAFYEIEYATTPGGMIYNIIYKDKHHRRSFSLIYFNLLGKGISHLFYM